MVKRIVYIPKSMDKAFLRMAKKSKVSYSQIIVALLEVLFVRKP